MAAFFYYYHDFSNRWPIATSADCNNLMGSPSVIQIFHYLSIDKEYYFAYPILAYAVLRATFGSQKVFSGILLVATAPLQWGWMF